MSLLDIEWFRCRDKYRIEERPERPGKFVAAGTEGGSFIVPNSRNWESYRPLDIAAPYKAFTKWDGTDKGLVNLANAYGSMKKPKAAAEPLDEVRAYAEDLRDLVRAIDASKWHLIKPGIGRLGVVFDLKDGQPTLRLQPPTLIEALQAQALFDVEFGIAHKKCKNPECDRWFPTTGKNAFRSDAEYHSEACRRRHVYILSKKGR